MTSLPHGDKILLLSKAIASTAAVKATSELGAASAPAEYIVCAPLLISSYTGTVFASLLRILEGTLKYRTAEYEDSSNVSKESMCSCPYCSVIPDDVSYGIIECPEPLCPETVRQSCPVISVKDFQFYEYGVCILLGIVVSIAVGTILLKVLKLRITNALNLREYVHARICQNPSCINAAKDAELIFLEGDIRPICNRCAVQEDTQGELVAIIDNPSECVVCSFPATYTCIKCQSNICFSLFHTCDDKFCYRIYAFYLSLIHI